MKFKNAFYLPSGRVFLLETHEGYPVECTEMRDVLVGGKNNIEVRNSSDPHVIWNHLDNYENKWLLTVSTQRGCAHNCKFCDVADLPFKGNLTYNEIFSQVEFILKSTPYVTKSDKVKIGFARMGEPAHNLDVVLGIINDLPYISNKMGKDFNWLPCFNTILPRKTLDGLSGFEVIDKVLEVKEKNYNGFLHFQISCNSTDEAKRKELFGGAEVLSLKEIIEYINNKDITNRTVTLNFIVIDGVEIDVQKLADFGLNGDKFTVKLIPLNNTVNSSANNLETYANYANMERLEELTQKFRDLGVPVVMDAIAKCEEAGLCCGQLAHIFIKK